MTCTFSENVTLPKVYFKHFASKNQLPGFYKKEKLVENTFKNLTLLKENLAIWAKMLILIYRKHYLSKLIIWDIDRKLKHAGIQQTLA